MLLKDVPLRTRRVLMLLKDVLLRTRRVLMLLKDVLLRTRRVLINAVKRCSVENQKGVN